MKDTQNKGKMGKILLNPNQKIQKGKNIVNNPSKTAKVFSKKLIG